MPDRLDLVLSRSLMQVNIKHNLAAEVKGFVGKEHMDFKAAKRMELFAQYAVAAAKEAVAECRA